MAPPEEQQAAFRLFQSERGIKKTIRTLVSRHRSKSLPAVPDLGDLARQLSALDTSKFGPVSMAVIRAPGRVIFLTEEIYQALRSQEELTLTCASNSR